MADDDDYEGSFAEDAASAVSAALKFAEKDDLRGTVTFRSSEDGRYDAECSTLEDVSSHLIEIYDEHWYSSVPFDGGSAVFEADAAGHVGDALADEGFEEFFEKVREPDDAEKILSARDLLSTPANSKSFRHQFNLVSGELIAHFAKHPHKLREIDPEDFEKLMEAIFRNQGFDVERTRFSKDGGVDLILVQKDSVGSAMTLVDCKRYKETKRVGVDVVRGLYGIVEHRDATRGMIVTTSSFTKDAVTFCEDVQYRMALADYDKIKGFLASWRSVARSALVVGILGRGSSCMIQTPEITISSWTRWADHETVYGTDWDWESERNVIQQNVTENYRDANYWYTLSKSASGAYTIDVTKSKVGKSHLGTTYYCQGWLRLPTA